MTWPNWNPRQARFLLKMRYDIGLIFAAVKRARNRQLDMRSDAQEYAFDGNYIEIYDIPSQVLSEIIDEPIRAYLPKYIRSRLTLPNDKDSYPKGRPVVGRGKGMGKGWYWEKRADDGSILPSLAPKYPPIESRSKTLITWGKQRYERLQEIDDRRDAARISIKRWITDGKKEPKKTLIRSLKIDPATFYRTLHEVENIPLPWQQTKYQTKRVFYKGVCVWLPRPELIARFNEFGGLSPFRQEAYDFAYALDPTFSFPSDTEIVPGFVRDPNAPPAYSSIDWIDIRVQREIEDVLRKVEDRREHD